MRFYHTSSMPTRFALCVALVGIATRIQAQPKPRQEPDNADTFLRRKMEARHVPGMQVVVVNHGNVVLSRGYGVASLQDATPVTMRTVLPVYSITKAFTGVAAMQLVEASKLDMAAPLSRYLDGLPQAWQPVTIRQLLTHTSGLPNIMDNETGALIAAGEEASWAKVISMPMEFAPGEKFSYCQTNYMLIGRIIDKLGGEPFIRFITEKQLKVVGMPLTCYGDGHSVIAHGAGDYLLAPGKADETRPLSRYKNDFVEYSPSLFTAAGLNTTAEELAQWALAVQKGKLFRDRATLDLLWTPGRLNNGSTQGLQSGLQRLRGRMASLDSL